jgi:hypothetical protein
MLKEKEKKNKRKAKEWYGKIDTQSLSVTCHLQWDSELSLKYSTKDKLFCATVQMVMQDIQLPVKMRENAFFFFTLLSFHIHFVYISYTLVMVISNK